MKYSFRQACWLIASVLFSNVAFSQTTELFETETIGGTTFTDNSQGFTIVNGPGETTYDVENFTNGGWDGSNKDNRFIDNSAGAPATGDGSSFTVKTTDGTDIYMKSFYLFVSNRTLSNSGQPTTLTFTAKKNGSTVYTVVKTSGIVDGSTFSPDNGYTFIDFSTEGGSDNSTTAMDEIVISSTGNADYLALDAMTWDNVPACTDPDVPTVTRSANNVCPGTNVTLDWAGANLNSATNWHIYTTNCGTGQLTSQTGTSLIVTPSTTTTYYVRGEDGAGCVDESTGLCGSITVTVADNTDPTITCPGNQNIYANASCQASLPDYTSLGTPSDNCDPSPSVTQSPAAGTTITSNTVVTLTATDASSNTGNCNFTVFFLDTTSPTLSSVSNQNVYANASCQASLPDYTSLPTKGDNCGTPTVTQSPVAGTTINSNTVVTLTATDASSNTKQRSFTVIFSDTTSPTLSSVSNQNVYANASCQASLPDYTNLPTKGDNCGTPTVTQSPVAGTTITSNTVVTLTATDASSNTTQRSFTVIFSDTTSPVAVCQNVTVYLNGSGNATITAGDIDNGSTDNCGAISLSASQTAFTCADIGANNVTLTVTDGSSNTDNCVSTVTIADTSSPVAVAQNITVYLDGSGNATITAGDIDNGSTDNCGALSLTASQTAFTCADIGANNVTLTATDGSSNTGQAIATVTIADTTSPTVTSVSNQTVYANGSCQASLPDYTSLTTEADNCGTPTVSQSPVAGTTINSNTVVTLTATDGSSNTGTTQFTVVFSDTTSPVAVCQDMTVYLDGTGNATITAGDIDNGSTDNCGAVSLGIDVSAFNCTNIGANTVTLTATDGSSNTGTCTATVTIADTTRPVVATQDITVYLDGTGNASITTGDIDNGSTDNCTVASLGLDVSAFTCAEIGANTVTLTVTDGEGNVNTGTATVTIADTTSPTVTSVSNQTVYANGSCQASLPDYTSLTTEADNCGTPTITQSPVAGTTINSNTVVTLTATDGSSNTGTTQFTVVFSDTTSPVAVCQDITVYLDGTGNATITAGDIDNGSTDNCGAVSLGIDVSAFNCTNIGANTVTLTATDGSSNTGTCTSTVTIADTTRPVVATQDITVYLDGSGNATITTGDIDNGSTDNCTVASLGLDVSAFTCAEIGANTVTLTVTDGEGNANTGTATVTIADTTRPVVATQDITVYLDGSGNATITTGDIDNGSTDNCTVASLGLDVSAFTCAEIGANTVTLTVTDGEGNANTGTATVTVADTTSPTAACQDITVYLDGTGNATLTAGDIDNGSTDNCGTPTLGIDVSAFNCANIGANTVTLTVTDGSSNTGTCTSTVTIADTTRPIVATQNITVYLDGTGNAAITTGDIDNGSTDNCAVASLGLDVSSFTCSEIGANTVTLTVTDGEGNANTGTATVTVADTTSPTLTAVSDQDQYADASCQALLADYTGMTSGSDNCGSPVVTQSPAAGTVITANTPVTLTVTDGSGNTNMTSFTVNYSDTTSPTAMCQDITVYLDGSGNASITAADVDNGSTDNCGAVTLAADVTAFTCAELGANTVTLTVTDGSSNTSNCTSTVTVADTTRPTVATQDITVYLDGSGNATITTGDIDNGSTDNCTVASLGLDVSSFTCSEIGANTVTLTVTDGEGNANTGTATVTVADTTSPTLTAVSDQDQYADASCQALLADYTGMTSGSDNCGSPVVTQSPAAGTVITANTPVTLTVTDGSGNTNMTSFTVNYSDTTSPTAMCQDITVYLDGSGNVSITAADVDNGSTDNCGAVTLAADVTAFTCAELGANTVTLTVTDGSSNTSNCTSTVTVADTTRPTVATQDITVYLDGSGNATITTGDIDNGSTDNCTVASLGLDVSSFTCSEIGANTVTLTVTDGEGNANTGTATVTVADTTSPTLTAVSDQDQYADASCQALLADYTGMTSGSDNCGSPVVTQSPAAGTVITANTPVTLTVTDGSGNTNMTSFTVNYSDTTSPTAMCQDITVYLDGSGNASITAADVDNGSTDNCGAVTLAADVTAFTCAELGANTVTLTVTDGSSNTSNCTSTVTVADTTRPTVATQDITVYLDGTGNASITTGEIDNGSTDNCTVASLGLDMSSFTCSEIGANTVTLTVTDGEGNANTGTATVTVADTTSPTLTAVSDQDQYADASCQALLADYTGMTSGSDNCGSPVVTQSPAAGTVITANTPVTLTVTDGSGNTNMTSFTVNYSDTTSPSAMCQDITVYLDGSGNVSITAADVDNGSTDNCGAVTLAADVTAFTCAEVGANTVMLTVTDASGNTSNCTSTVTVMDTISPTIACPGNQTEYIAANCVVALPDYTGLVTSGDNCSGVTVTQTPAAGTDVNADLTVNMTATDASGNMTMCSFDVTILDTNYTIATPVIACDSVEVHGNWYFTSQVVEDTLTAVAGCDSIVFTAVTINNMINVNATAVVACDSAEINGNWYFTAQTVVDSMMTTAGCDSIIYTDLTINNSIVINKPDVVACDSVEHEGTWYFASVTLIDSMSTIHGCDSIEITEVIINNSYSNETFLTICEGDSIEFGGMFYTTAGTYIDSLATVHGCDSIETLNLSFQAPQTIMDTVSICTGDSYEFGFQTLTIGGDYSTIFNSVHGCDSTVYLHLNVGVENMTVSVSGATMTSDQDGADYQWIDCGNNNDEIAGATSQSYTPTVNGDYAVIVDDGMCVDTSDCISIQNIGIATIIDADLAAYPNPTSGELTVEFSQNLMDVTIQVRDIQGRILPVDIQIENGKAFINMSHLSRGYYLLMLNSSQASASLRIEKS